MLLVFQLLLWRDDDGSAPLAEHLSRDESEDEFRDLQPDGQGSHTCDHPHACCCGAKKDVSIRTYDVLYEDSSIEPVPCVPAF